MNESNTLTKSHFSAAASLAALGAKVQQMNLFGPIAELVHIAQKSVKYTPIQKLSDAWISLLAGAQGLVQINTVLRIDPGLQHAFGRSACAEQSVVQETLSACTRENVEQLHRALDQIFAQHSQASHHDFSARWLILDADMTGMPCGKKAAFATRGYFANQKRTRRGRQLGRVLASQYQEIVTDRLFAGNVQLLKALVPLMQAAQTTLQLGAEQRARTLVRVDAGGGTRDDVNWLLTEGYQVLAKEYCSKRVQRLLKTVPLWYQDPDFPERSFGWVSEEPNDYVRPLRRLAVRTQRHDGTLASALLMTSLSSQDVLAMLALPHPPTSDEVAELLAVLHLYDLRGAGIETAFKDDKQGLGLGKRNKKRMEGQELLIGLSQLAHNVLVWAKGWLSQEPTARPILLHYGIKRLVRDLLHIPGFLLFDGHGRLLQVMLTEQSALARRLLPAWRAFLAPVSVVVNLGQT